VVLREAQSSAQMHLARVANRTSLYAISRTMATLDAVSPLIHILEIMILSERSRCMRGTQLWCDATFGCVLFQQLVHQLNTKVELIWMHLPNRPELMVEQRQMAGLQRMHRRRS
jgi:hypothetical protein